MRIYFLILFILGSLSLNAQDTHKADIEKTFNAYEAVLVKGDYKKTMDYIHPALFQFASRESIEKAMAQLFESEMFSVQFSDMKLGEVSEPFEYEGSLFAQMSYNGQMNFNVEQEELLPILEEAFKGQFGEDQVQTTKDNKLIVYINNSKGFMIKDEGADWKLLRLSDDQKEIVEQILPEAVRTHFDIN